MKKSFTLIELLVVIGIVVLITAASIVGISNSRNRRQVKTTADRIKYIITEAISEAKIPNDTMFGVSKIQVRIYPHNSNTSIKDTVQIFDVDSSNNPASNPRVPPFQAPAGVYIYPEGAGVNAGVTNSHMSCFPVNNSVDCASIDYYYFSILVGGASAGQLTDVSFENLVSDQFFYIYIQDVGYGSEVPNSSAARIKIPTKSGLIISNYVDSPIYE